MIMQPSSPNFHLALQPPPPKSPITKSQLVDNQKAIKKNAQTMKKDVQTLRANGQAMKKNVQTMKK